MLLSKFLNLRTFYISWGIIGALLALAWARYLAEPKRTATSVGMTRVAALRALAILSVGWYVVLMSVRGLFYLLR